MDFTRKKLPLEMVPEMRVCPIESVQAYAPLPAPLYVLLASNEKFLAVKSPLDFLSPSDLQRLKSFENFYYPPFIREVLPFRIAARTVVRLLSGAQTSVGLRPAPFETSDAFLRLTAPLWSPLARVEPFFISAFATEVCGPLPPDLATRARESNLKSYENAVLKSAWVVWQALHLDLFDLNWIRGLRDHLFEAVALSGAVYYRGAELGWLQFIVDSEMPASSMALSDLSCGTIHRKLVSREQRLSDVLVLQNRDGVSILGERGLIQEEVA